MAKKQMLSLTDEKVLRKILWLFVSITMILLVQGVYNIMSINNVDGSIQTLYKAMEQINQIEEEINIPIGKLRRLSMTQVMAPNQSIAKKVNGEILELQGEIDKTVTHWESMASELKMVDEIKNLRTVWEAYKTSVATTSDWIEQRVREGAFLNNTVEEKEAFENVQEAIKKLTLVQFKTRDIVHQDALDTAQFSYWLSIITTSVEVIVMKIITFIIVGMINNYVKTMKQNAKDLEARREFFHSIIKNIPGVFYKMNFTKEGKAKLSYMSERAQEFFGINSEKAVAEGITPQNSLFTEESLTSVDKTRFEAVNNKKDFVQDYSVTDKEGRVRHFSEMGSFTKSVSELFDNNDTKAVDEEQREVSKEKQDSIIGFIFDITESKELEKQNDMQRRKITSLLSKIPIGVLTVGEDNKIGQYSPEVAKILETQNDLSQSDAVSEIFEKSTLTKEKISIQVAALSASIKESSLNFEMNQSCFTQEMSIKVSDDKLKYLEMTWSYIENAEGDVDEIILCMKDVTDLKKVKAREIEKNKHLKALEAVSNLDSTLAHNQFKSLSDSLNSALITARKSVTKTDKEEAFHFILRNLHTLKGNSRSLDFIALSEETHDAETILLEEHTVTEKAVQAIESCKKSFDKYFETAKNLEKITDDDTYLLQMNDTLFDDINLSIQSVKDEKTKTELFNKVNKMRGVSLERALTPILSTILPLSKKLNKQAPSLSFKENSIYFRRDRIPFFMDIFNHMIRNSIAHSLPDENTSSSNSEIKIAAQDNQDGNITFIYGDNGSGLNLDKITEKIKEKGLSVDFKNPQEIANSIFAPTFSTAQTVDDIAGRGVGMDAIKMEIEKLGGSINLILDNPNNNTTGCISFQIKVTIPRNNLCYTEDFQSVSNLAA